LGLGARKCVVMQARFFKQNAPQARFWTES